MIPERPSLSQQMALDRSSGSDQDLWHHPLPLSFSATRMSFPGKALWALSSKSVQNPVWIPLLISAVCSSLGRLPPGFKGFHSLPLQALWAAGRILLPYNWDQASPLGKCSHDLCPCQSTSQHPHYGPRGHPCLMTSLSSCASLSQQSRGGPPCFSHTE